MAVVKFLDLQAHMMVLVLHMTDFNARFEISPVCSFEGLDGDCSQICRYHR